MLSPVLTFRPLAHPFPVPVPGRCSDELLVDLIALNEEMSEQLRLERGSATSSADFLTRMIEQHERAAALLRAELAPDGNPAA